MGAKQVLMGVLCYAGVVLSQGMMGVRQVPMGVRWVLGRC